MKVTITITSLADLDELDLDVMKTDPHCILEYLDGKAFIYNLVTEDNCSYTGASKGDSKDEDLKARFMKLHDDTINLIKRSKDNVK